VGVVALNSKVVGLAPGVLLLRRAAGEKKIKFRKIFSGKRLKNAPPKFSGKWRIRKRKLGERRRTEKNFEIRRERGGE
jgi:hypothetical protein